MLPYRQLSTEIVHRTDQRKRDARMHLRLICEVTGLPLGIEPVRGLTFVYEGEFAVTITIEPLEGKYSVTAYSAEAPDHTDLIALPDGVAPSPESEAHLDGSFKELHERLKATVQVLRWRYGLSQQFTQLLSKGRAWSTDGSHWRGASRIRGFDLLVGVPYSIKGPSDAVVRDVQKLVQDGIGEPLGRELYREACKLKQSSTRSALVLGVAAIEVGIKELISELVPNSSWLVDNLPSPPIEKLYGKYLPTLPLKAVPLGKSRALPPPLMKHVKRAVEARNLIVHTGQESDGTFVHDFLLSASDILWILDVFRGFTWAYGYIRPESIKAWPA